MVICDRKWLIGIDEAGRGPLAGPVAVGVVCVPRDFDWLMIDGVADSKSLSETKRERLYKVANVLISSGAIEAKVSLVSASMIDKNGITKAVESAMQRALRRLSAYPKECEVLLDGSLKAPAIYDYQRTIIKGDVTEPVIGLASIMAKVRRDRYMERIAALPQFAPYEFAIHKGYGTKKHREIIKKHGLSAMHRRSFCRNLL